MSWEQEVQEASEGDFAQQEVTGDVFLVQEVKESVQEWLEAEESEQQVSAPPLSLQSLETSKNAGDPIIHHLPPDPLGVETVQGQERAEANQ